MELRSAMRISATTPRERQILPVRVVAAVPSHHAACCQLPKPPGSVLALLRSRDFTTHGSHFVDRHKPEKRLRQFIRNNRTILAPPKSAHKKSGLAFPGRRRFTPDRHAIHACLRVGRGDLKNIPPSCQSELRQHSEVFCRHLRVTQRLRQKLRKPALLQCNGSLYSPAPRSCLCGLPRIGRRMNTSRRTRLPPVDHPSKCFAIVAGILCASGLCIGCMSPMHTRLPTWWAAHPQAESQAYQRQDPFPDVDLGPDTMSRPREFTRPRSESRRAAEQRLLQGVPVGPEHVPPGVPQGGLSRPAAVY